MALECLKGTVTVHRQMCPHRHKSGTPVAVCRVDPEAIEAAAAVIVEKVRSHQRAGRGLSYVYIAPDMSVYVIHEQHAAAKDWASDLKGRWHWFVGVYSAERGRDALTAKREGVVEDICEHLIQMAASA